jgi:23S rRNA pseudouridine955/2504/2580 synthase
MTKFTIKTNDANQSIFKFIKKSFKTTPLSVIYKWFRTGAIKVNGRKIKDQKLILTIDDAVEVYDQNKPQIRDQFKYVEKPNLNVVYEDENILIVNKPANVEVHSPINIALDDLVKSYLVEKKEYDPQTESSFVVSHVHRLDKLTNGLIIYAKNKMSLDVLLTCFQDKIAIEKYYLAKIKSVDWTNDFTADGWIRYDPEEQISVFREKEKTGYKSAKTIFKFFQTQGEDTWIEAQLITGRKHQIRATLAYYQMPIINDFRYGGWKVNSQRLIYLTAYKLIFRQMPAPLNYLNGRVFELKLTNPE